MSSRTEQAAERHARGYNCAQAVACAYADLVGIDETTLFRATEGLGLGMGSMDGTCGALSGACVLAGLVNSTGDIEHPSSKKSTYALSRQMVQRFLDANGTCVCRELKGVDTGVVVRSCPGCVEDAARIVEDVLFSDR